MARLLSLLRPGRLFPNPVILLFGLLLIKAGVQAQNCINRITLESGTQHFSCTDVTVTSEDYVDFWSWCGIGPYWIGFGGPGLPGSFIFTFSTPVAGVTLDLTAFDNHSNPPNFGAYEIVTLEINGAPYPFPNAGSPGGCLGLVVVNASGGLEASPAPGLGVGSCVGLNISTQITTIKITNTAYDGNTGGVMFNIYFCCDPCVTKAGLIPSAPLSLCSGDIATVPPAAPNILPAGTMLEYILFSDPSDTLGSILLISNTPTFSFDPAVMQEGVTYYIAAIAGNDLNGHVDLNDKCLDISDNAIPVIWWPRPTVAFSINKPDVCKGNCVDVQVELTGEPPFTLAYNNPFTGQTIKTFFGQAGIYRSVSRQLQHQEAITLRP